MATFTVTFENNKAETLTSWAKAINCAESFAGCRLDNKARIKRMLEAYGEASGWNSIGTQFWFTKK